MLDEHVATGRRALVVDVEGAAPVREGAVVDHADQLRRDLLPEPPAERGHALAVEVALEPVPHRFVEEDARPARTEHDRHRPRRRADGPELQHRLPHGLAREAPPPVRVQEVVEGHAPAPAVGAQLAGAALLRDHRHVESGERAHVARGPARRGRDIQDDLFARERGDHLRDPRVRRARLGIDAPQQVELGRQIGRNRGHVERIEVARRPAGRDGDAARGRRPVGDRPRRAGSLLEVREGDLVGVRVPRARLALGAHPGPLAHVSRGLLDRALLEQQLLVDPVLEIDVGVVDAPAQRGPEDSVEQRRRKREAVRKEALRKHRSPLRGLQS